MYEALDFASTTTITKNSTVFRRSERVFYFWTFLGHPYFYVVGGEAEWGGVLLSRSFDFLPKRVARVPPIMCMGTYISLPRV